MKIKVFEAIETFRIVTNEEILIEKGQKIPEDFFTKNFEVPENQINVLLKLKKIKAAGTQDTDDDRPVNLNTLNKAALLVIAKEKGLPVDEAFEKLTNANIVSEIRAKEAEEAEAAKE